MEFYRKFILHLFRYNGIRHVHIEDETLDINYPYLKDEFLLEITKLNVTLDVYGRHHAYHDRRKWEKIGTDWNEQGISSIFMPSSEDGFGFRLLTERISVHLNIVANEQRKNLIAYRVAY